MLGTSGQKKYGSPVSAAQESRSAASDSLKMGLNTEGSALSRKAGVSPPKKGTVKPKPGMSASAASAGSASLRDGVRPLEMELQERPDLVYEPQKIRSMLLAKISQLGETIRKVQANNFEIEDDVLDKLRLLKGFNDKLQEVSAHSAQQARTLRESLSQSQDDRSRILSEKEAHNDQMSDKLIQMEG